MKLARKTYYFRNVSFVIVKSKIRYLPNKFLFSKNEYLKI